MAGLEAVRQALRLLRAHKARSLLTLFGLVWGTAAVILLVSWGEGVRVMLERGFFKTGKNMGEVWAGRISEDFNQAVREAPVLLETVRYWKQVSWYRDYFPDERILVLFFEDLIVA